MDKHTPSPSAVPRRSALRFLAASGLAGATWGTGFAMLNADRAASVTVAGDKDWQLTVAESRSSRAVVLMGQPDGQIEDTLARMMGAFRQRIDLVIGGADALAFLPQGYGSRWNVQRTIVLGDAVAGSTVIDTGTTNLPARIALGARLSILLSPVLHGAWSDNGEGEHVPDRWIVSIMARGAIVRVGSRLEDIVALNAGPTAMSVAPSGDLRLLWTFDPTSGIAVNNAHVPDDVVTSHESPRRWLVGVFPEDFSRFTFLDRSVALPAWARPVEFLGGSGRVIRPPHRDPLAASEPGVTLDPRPTSHE